MRQFVCPARLNARCWLAGEPEYPLLLKWKWRRPVARYRRDFVEYRLLVTAPAALLLLAGWFWSANCLKTAPAEPLPTRAAGPTR